MKFSLPDYETCNARMFSGRVSDTTKVERICALHMWMLDLAETIEQGHLGADLFYLVCAIANDVQCAFYPSRYEQVLTLIDDIIKIEEKMAWLNDYIDRTEV